MRVKLKKVHHDHQSINQSTRIYRKFVVDIKGFPSFDDNSRLGMEQLDFSVGKFIAEFAFKGVEGVGEYSWCFHVGVVFDKTTVNVVWPNCRVQHNNVHFGEVGRVNIFVDPLLSSEIVQDSFQVFNEIYI